MRPDRKGYANGRERERYEGHKSFSHHDRRPPTGLLRLTLSRCEPLRALAVGGGVPILRYAQASTAGASCIHAPGSPSTQLPACQCAARPHSPYLPMSLLVIYAGAAATLVCTAPGLALL